MDMLIQEYELREGTFEWKVDNFLGMDQNVKIWSPSFKFGTYVCRLNVENIILNSNNIYFFNVCRTVENSAVVFGTNLTYKVSLIDRTGQASLTKKETFQKYPSCLLTVDKSYLRSSKNDILPEGVLTIRLSWYRSKKSEEDKQTTPYKLPEIKRIALLEALSKNLCSYYENKTDTDCVLRVGSSQFPAHRQVLSARSEIFSAMFRHDSWEKRNGVVDIPDVDASILSEVLHYIYSGQIRELTGDIAISMYIVAHKYGLIELKDVCLDVIKCSLSVQNVCDAARLAHTYGESTVWENAVHFMVSKGFEIKNSDGWKELSRDKPSLAIDLLYSAFMKYKEETSKLTPKKFSNISL